MRRAARTDANQKEVVANLRKLGFSVQHLHQLGKGCPDLLIGKEGRNWLFELKDPDKPPSARQLTEDEKKWFHTWRGQVDIGYDAESIVDLIDYMMGK